MISIRKYYCIAILFIVIVSSCKKSAMPVPVTCGSVSVDSTAVGQQVLFLNCTKGATRSLWAFGDDSVSAFDTLYHTYYKPGTYTVTLTASNANGNGIVKTFSIVVTAADFWSFKGTNYYGSNLGSRFGQALNYITSYGPYGTSSYVMLGLFLGGDTVSNYSGSDTVISTFPARYITDVLVSFSIGSQTYIPDTTNGGVQRVQVNIVNKKASFIGTSIKVVNSNIAADTGSISFNLKQ